MTIPADKAPPPHRTQIPNIVDDLGLDPYERALYVHYKRVCGENQGAYCFEATKTTAQKTRMSAAQVSVSRRVLEQRGLVIIQEGRPVVVTVVNIWELNTAFYLLEHRPDVEGWTVEQLKLWLADVHTVNVSSHNESDIGTRSERNLTEDVKDVHTVNVTSHSEHSLTDKDNMSSNVHTVKQRSKESLSLESTPNKESKDSSPNGEGDKHSLSDEPAIKIEYTPYLRDFLARFNAKRFRNATQFKTVSDLVEQHGEAELSSLAEWAANKGMGLGQAIPAIKSALTNPKRKGHVPEVSESDPLPEPLASTGHYADPIPPPALTPEETTLQKALSDCQQQVPPWLAADIRTEERTNGTFWLIVSTERAKDWIDNRLKDKILRPALKRVDQSVEKVEVKINDTRTF